VVGEGVKQGGTEDGKVRKGVMDGGGSGDLMGLHDEKRGFVTCFTIKSR
jgi:hypothetical protein